MNLDTKTQNVHPPPSTDIIMIDTLQLSANLGADCWGKTRVQPIEITVHLHLHAKYLNTSSVSDDVRDSVHYGLLTKDISGVVKKRFGDFDIGSESGSGPVSSSSGGDGDGQNKTDSLLLAIAQSAFSLGGAAISEVHIILTLPKLILLASGGLSVDATFYHPDPHSALNGPEALCVRSKKVLVHDLVLPAIIGVNPPEREEKQRVVINVVFYEDIDSNGPQPDYQHIMSNLIKELEPTSYLTLEKFVMHIVRFVCLANPRISAVTARAQKPSALTFAGSSGVEITRERSAFV